MANSAGWIGSIPKARACGNCALAHGHSLTCSCGTTEQLGLGRYAQIGGARVALEQFHGLPPSNPFGMSLNYWRALASFFVCVPVDSIAGKAALANSCPAMRAGPRVLRMWWNWSVAARRHKAILFFAGTDTRCLRPCR